MVDKLRVTFDRQLDEDLVSIAAGTVMDIPEPKARKLNADGIVRITPSASSPARLSLSSDPVATPTSVAPQAVTAITDVASPTAGKFYTDANGDIYLGDPNGLGFLPLTNAQVYDLRRDKRLTSVAVGESNATVLDAAAAQNDLVFAGAFTPNDYPTTRIILLPYGRFPFATQLQFRQNTILRGVFGGDGGSELWWRGGDGIDAITNANIAELSNGEISGLRIVDKRTSPTTGRGIAAYDYNNRVLLYQLQVYDFPLEQIYVGSPSGSSGDCSVVDDVWVGNPSGSRPYAKGILFERLDNTIFARNIKSDLGTTPANDGYVIRSAQISNDFAVISVDGLKHEANNRCPTLTFPFNTRANLAIKNVMQRNPTGGAAGAGDIIQVGAQAGASSFAYDHTAQAVTANTANGSDMLTGMTIADVRKCTIGAPITGTGIPANTRVYRQGPTWVQMTAAATADGTAITVTTAVVTGATSEGGGRMTVENVSGANHSDWTGASGAAVVRCLGSAKTHYGFVGRGELGQNGRFVAEIVGTGDPNAGAVYGNVGYTYRRLDGTASNPCTFVKRSGDATNSGWWPTMTSNGYIKAIGNSGTTFTPDLALGDTFTATLNNNCTITNASGASTGMTVTFVLTQDGTGGRTPTWGNRYIGATLTTSGGAGQQAIVVYRVSGSDLVQIANSGWFTVV